MVICFVLTLSFILLPLGVHAETHILKDSIQENVSDSIENESELLYLPSTENSNPENSTKNSTKPEKIIENDQSKENTTTIHESEVLNPEIETIDPVSVFEKEIVDTVDTNSVIVEETNRSSDSKSNENINIEELVDPVPITVEEYKKNVKDFHQLSIIDVEHFFTQEKNGVIYIGRPTCYYCREFSPELKRFNLLLGNTLSYYNTDGSDFNEYAADLIFKQIGIPGTPTTIYLKNGQIVSAWVGGGITAAKLYAFLFQNEPKTEENQPSTDTVEENEDLSVKVEENHQMIDMETILSTDMNNQKRKDFTFSVIKNTIKDSEIKITPFSFEHSQKNDLFATPVSSGFQLNSNIVRGKLPKLGENNPILSILIGSFLTILSICGIEMNKHSFKEGR
ncbi:hypothetical protein Y136_15450 [Listeria monocytogenes]|nr:hypothetical protein [Listeria monocytogenes]EAE0903933.1 hypothetical protein [Listeria monocytogenes]